MRVRTAILTAVLGLSLTSATAHSKPLTATEDTQCLTIGAMAHQLAELRDHGITRAQMTKVVNANSSPLTKESNEAIVAFIYGPSRPSPDLVLYGMYTACKTGIQKAKNR